MEFKTVLITGGAGFLGSHLADALISRSKKVIVIDKKKPSEKIKNPKVDYFVADVGSEKARKIIQKTEPEVIFHLAAHIHDRESIREPIMNAKENILGSLTVFEAAKELKKTRVVFSSTGLVYGAQEDFPLGEERIPHPLTPYAVSKLAAEKYLHFYHSIHGLSAIALRFGNIYGARQDSSAESGAISIFAARLLRGEQAYVNNDGATVRDYVYVDDIVDALLKAAKSSSSGLLNIGSGKGTSTLELYRMVQNAVGVVMGEPEYREEVEDLVKRVELDSSLAASVLKWKPKTSLEEGVEKTVEWYRLNA